MIEDVTPETRASVIVSRPRVRLAAFGLLGGLRRRWLRRRCGEVIEDVTPEIRASVIVSRPRVRLAAFALLGGFLAVAPRVQAAPAPAVIAALAPGPDGKDAREAVVVGPHGQAYEPDGKGTWVRRHATSLADDVVRAARAGALVIAAVEAGPPYAYRVGKVAAADGGGASASRTSDSDGVGAWNLVVLGLHAKAIVGRGPRATAAFGKQVFGLDTGKPVKLADAPGPVTALAATRKAVVVETDKGLAKLDGGKWKPIKNAPKQVIALLDDRWAVVDRGLLDLGTQKVTPWPAGFRVASVVAVANDLVVAAGLRGGTAELVTLRAGKLDREPIALAAPAATAPAPAPAAHPPATPAAPTAPTAPTAPAAPAAPTARAPAAKLGTGAAAIVALVADGTGRVVVAARDGQLAVRDKAGAWTAGELRAELPAERPGSPPAESR